MKNKPPCSTSNSVAVERLLLPTALHILISARENPATLLVPNSHDFPRTQQPDPRPDAVQRGEWGDGQCAAYRNMATGAATG
jgi:hypothetical protein